MTIEVSFPKGSVIKSFQSKRPLQGPSITGSARREWTATHRDRWIIVRRQGERGTAARLHMAHLDLARGDIERFPALQHGLLWVAVSQRICRAHRALRSRRVPIRCSPRSCASLSCGRTILAESLLERELEEVRATARSLRIVIDAVSRLIGTGKREPRLTEVAGLE